MRTVYALLLSLIGLIAIVFNRFCVEETQKLRPPWVWWWPSPAIGRVIVILTGIFFVGFGLLMALGFMQ